MPEALSSFLISVSIIVAIALILPCIESITNLLRSNSRKQASMTHGEAGKVFSRKVA